MAVLQKGVPGLEVANDALNAIVSKCLGYPKRGTYVGGGPTTATMPDNWNGVGATPWGWTKQPTTCWFKSSLDTIEVIDDATAALLALPENQANLLAGEIVTLTAALAARVTVDTELYLPKP